MARGEIGQRGAGAGIFHAAAGDQHRTLRSLQRRHGVAQLRAIGLGRAGAPDALAEEAVGDLHRLRLHILGKGEGDGAAFHRVGQHAHRRRQRSQQLFGAHDPVEQARDGAETVIGRDGGIARHLDLLQHRVGAAAGEDVAGQEQHRQAVHMRQRRRRHHVGRTWPDRGRAGHHPPPRMRLGEGDGGMRHGLFVVRAESGQGAAMRVQRGAEARDIAMAEDGPDAAEQRHDAAVDLGLLRGQETDRGFGRRQA